MNTLINKLVLLGLCFVLLLLQPNDNPVTVTAFLTAVCISMLYTFHKSALVDILCLIYILLSCFRTEFFIFLPLIIYDAVNRKNTLIKLLCLCPFLFLFPSILLFPAGIFSLLSVLLYYRTHTANIRQNDYHDLQDILKEETIHMEQKNREIIEKQDYEVKLAMSNERNRIAREIHDNVGHLLTRSLLQLGALEVIHRDDPVKEELSSIKETLSDAMDNIRSSVHDLHNESIDLKLQLESIIKGFDFCHVKLNYDAGELPKDLKYSFISIVREALSNIARHSNATLVNISLIEHPAIWQLMIQDNGTVFNKEHKSGIGLVNMEERIKFFHGTMRNEFKNGFCIFISIPRKRGVK